MTQQTPSYFTIKEFAALVRLDHKTVRKGIKDGHIPALRVGRSFRIPASAVDALAALRRDGTSR